MIHIHASGVLLSAPQSRTSAKGGSYVTGALRCATKSDESTMVSFVCFSESAQQELLSLQAGDALTVAGPGKLDRWTGKDGVERHGLSVVVDRLLPHQPGKAKPAARAEPSPAPRKREPELELSDSDDLPF